MRWIRKSSLMWMLACMSLGPVLASTGCGESFEEAGERAEEAGEEIEDEVDDAT